MAKAIHIANAFKLSAKGEAEYFEKLQRLSDGPRRRIHFWEGDARTKFCAPKGQRSVTAFITMHIQNVTCMRCKARYYLGTVHFGKGRK